MIGDPRRSRSQQGAVRLFITVGWLIVITTAFVLGYFLAGHDVDRMQARIALLQRDLDRSSEQLAAARQQRIQMERTHQIDAEARRSAQTSLEHLQRERLDLIKRTTYLERLIRAGGSGLIEVTDFALAPEGTDRRFRFAFTIRQRFPDGSDSTGTLKLKLEADGTSIPTPVRQADSVGVRLSDSVRFQFARFQQIQGELSVPDDMDPDTLLIELIPDNDRNIALEERFAWEPNGSLNAEIAMPTPETTTHESESLE